MEVARRKEKRKEKTAEKQTRQAIEAVWGVVDNFLYFALFCPRFEAEKNKNTTFMDTISLKPMKKILPLLLLFVTSSALAQQQEQPKDTIIYEYKARYYNPSFCGCGLRKKDTTTIKKDTLKLPPVTFYREQKNRQKSGGLGFLNLKKAIYFHKRYLIQSF